MPPLLDNPTQRCLWDHWHAVRAGRKVPRIADIALASLGPAADFVLLVEREAQRFRYIYVGAAIRRIYGYPMEGLFLDLALPPNRRAQAIERYALVCESGRPLLTRNAYEISPRLGFVVERLFLPLTRSGSGVDSVICAQVMQKAVEGATLGPATESRPAADELIFLDDQPPPSPAAVRAQL